MAFRSRIPWLLPAAAVLALFLPPVGPARAQTADGPRGLLDTASTASLASSTGEESPLPGMTMTDTQGGTEPPRCVRLTLVTRVQTSVAGTTADVLIRRADLNGQPRSEPVRAGASVYLIGSSGAGAATVTIVAYDVTATNGSAAAWEWQAYVKRTAGPGTVSTGQTTGTRQQMAAEDMGPGPASGITTPCDGAVAA